MCTVVDAHTIYLTKVFRDVEVVRLYISPKEKIAALALCAGKTDSKIKMTR